MKLRQGLSAVLIRLSGRLKSLAMLIHSMPVSIMRVDDLISMTNNSYCQSRNVCAWSNTEARGLYDYEQEFIKRYSLNKAKILALGAGGGREAWGFAEAGLEVTAIDISEAIIANAKNKLQETGNHNINFIRMSVYNLDFPLASFDAASFLGGSYSHIPSSGKRIEFLKKIRGLLKKEGAFILSFFSGGKELPTARFYPLYKLLAALTLGNREVQKGDHLAGDTQFNHAFLEAGEVAREAESAGFKVERIDIDCRVAYKYAYLRV